MDDSQKGFYVEPKTDCPHIETAFTPEVHAIAANGPCLDCQHADENWACLTCNKRFCSRYVNGHMKVHNDTSGHPIAVSYSDFSFWCYECDSYITSTVFGPLLRAMSVAKFGGAGTGGRYTAHATLQQMEELEDPPNVLQEKIRQLADMIRQSKHFIVFTGAGISTSAGIPDYRGPQGVWTLKAKGERRTAPTTPMPSALPTPCHMALVGLQNAGLLKHVVSQNVDGLHRRSGIRPECLSELHGNSNLEYCEKCGREYVRDFSCTHFATLEHVTGRRCAARGCDGRLVDTIINFGEKLPMHVVSAAFDHADRADLCLSLGSSLTVTPAADVPKRVGKKAGGQLVIVNLQRTPLDRLATLRIFGRTDDVMLGVCRHLGVDIPPFVLDRRVIVHRNGNTEIAVEGVDVDNTTPVSLFRGVEIRYGATGRVDAAETDVMHGLGGHQFVFSANSHDEQQGEIEITLHAMGHYAEPPLTIRHPANTVATMYRLQYVPETHEWHTSTAPMPSAAVASTEAMPSFPPVLDHIAHPEHRLKLETKPPYESGAFRCNQCLKVGHGAVYHCAACEYDLHPACALRSRH